MLQSLLSGLTTKPLDVQVWDCVPLVVADSQGELAYGQETKLEFTPFDETANRVGHAIALKPNSKGTQPEIAIDTRQYIDNPIELGRRQGIILTGTNQEGSYVTWYINGAADRFLTTPEPDEIEYDEEIAKILEEELANTEPTKLNLNSYL